MARIAVTWQPKDDVERAIVDGHLGGDAVWLVDDPGATTACDTALMFWPRTELRAAGKDWRDWPALRRIQLATAGANHVGWKSLPDHITVAVTPGGSGPAMAEWITGAILAWTRGLIGQTSEIKAGRFHLSAETRSVRDLTIGFVGYGGIARHTQAALTALATALPGLGDGPRFMAVTRTGDPLPDAELAWVGPTSQLPDMAAVCDALIVCAPLTTDTHGLVDMATLARMAGRPAMLVNVARGPVVNETDLFAWLDSDEHRHFAALDVWWQYPRLRDDAWPYTEDFTRLRNVLMTPHCSPNTRGYRHRMIDAACQRLRDWLDAGGDGELAGTVDASAYRHVGFDADPRG